MLLTAIFSLVSAAQIPNDSIVADFRYFVKQLEATHPDPYTNYGGKAFFHRAAPGRLPPPQALPLPPARADCPCRKKKLKIFTKHFMSFG